MYSRNFTVIYDACVLYPFHLRDILIRLAMTRMFRARWTDDIHDEWIRSLLRENPNLDASKLQRTKELMDKAVGDCLIEGYKPFIEQVKMDDPDDRHVVAAAIVVKAEVIVTRDGHFKPEVLDEYGIGVQTPDEFILSLFDLDAQVTYDAIDQARRACKTPPFTGLEYQMLLTRNGLGETANRMATFEEWSG